MTNALPATARRAHWGWYVVVLTLTGVGTFLLVGLIVNIQERKQEAQERWFPLVELDEDTVDPAVWGRNFPRQYDSYLRTVDTERTRHGGSEAVSKLEENPRLRRIFAGYPFSVDYREKRGHAYMLADQDQSERVKQFRQTGACLHCHSAVMPAYRRLGQGDVLLGFQKLCAMPWAEARQLVDHPVTCHDCHDPKTVQLRITRPGFLEGIKALARSDEPLPHLPSIERWRRNGRESDYDPNVLASRQELRSFVCAQCHVEYYFRGEAKLVTYPWHKGVKVERIESYYDEASFDDWVHAETGAKVVKAQHPEFELWNQGIHARSGVACADCHMPYRREGAIKISDHQVRSPLLDVARACQSCHRYSEAELLARVKTIQDRTRGLIERAEVALLELYDTFGAARRAGRPEASLATARARQRQAQWRVDFVASENSLGFHAPQEAARILAEAIDFARQGQVAVLRDAP
ncbi:MAG: ammonia-forming cytochrome c nitrite reductase subunit c552 [Gemmataceae bacterium]|nr:ammonia-forming cytochrome c nitrite reductase subunit c552 [Gemmataceae bacterium]MDW8265684.1 ammonia-forming cytochrome c nitrite reductase subunit c552 [Gemmataceae bacterium]